MGKVTAFSLKDGKKNGKFLQENLNLKMVTKLLVLEVPVALLLVVERMV